MSYKNLAVAAAAIFTFGGCTPAKITYGKDTPIDQRIKFARNTPNCNYELIYGQEIIFNSYPSESYVFFLFDHNIFNPNHPKVESYKNLHAKIKPDLLEGEYKYNDKINEVVVENCDILYIENKRVKDPFRSYSGYTLKSKLDDDRDKINKYKNLVGTNIWVGIGVNKTIRTKSNESKLLENYEKVTVKNILGEEDFKNTTLSMSTDILYFEVERLNGDIGYFPFVESSVSLSYPFPKSWPKDIIKMIHERKVGIGMSNLQALAAWGKPKSINRTVTSQGATEQWVYGSNTYIYLSNDLVKTIQN